LKTVNPSLGPNARVSSMAFTPIGVGQVDFKPVFANAALAGLEHFVVEHDNAASWGDSLAVARVSYQNMMKILSWARGRRQPVESDETVDVTRRLQGVPSTLCVRTNLSIIAHRQERDAGERQTANTPWGAMPMIYVAYFFELAQVRLSIFSHTGNLPLRVIA